MFCLAGGLNAEKINPFGAIVKTSGCRPASQFDPFFWFASHIEGKATTQVTETNNCDGTVTSLRRACFHRSGVRGLEILQ